MDPVADTFVRNLTETYKTTLRKTLEAEKEAFIRRVSQEADKAIADIVGRISINVSSHFNSMDNSVKYDINVNFKKEEAV